MHLHPERIPLARRVEQERLALAYGETAFTEARWTEVKLPCSLRYCGRPYHFFFASPCPAQLHAPHAPALLAGRHKEHPGGPEIPVSHHPGDADHRGPWAPLRKSLGVAPQDDCFRGGGDEGANGLLASRARHAW